MTAGDTTCVYVDRGSARVDSAGSAVGIHEAGLLGDGHAARVAADDGAPLRFLLLAARPPPEPVVQYGPFVMNTREEIEGAPAGCQSGQLTN